MQKLLCGFALGAATLGLAPADAMPSSARSRDAIARVKPQLGAALRAKNLTFGAPIYLRIFKEEKQLEVWMRRRDRYEHFRTYDICAYSGELGPKMQEGDGQSPEGFYRVRAAQLQPNSRFHLSFDLGYPNAYHRAHGRTGSALMVHGSCVSVGCYAMTDTRIEEIYALADAALRSGQRAFSVDIFPFRPTQRNMRRHLPSPWGGFWSDLKVAYDLFEQRRTPPAVTVQNRRYTVATP